MSTEGSKVSNSLLYYDVLPASAKYHRAEPLTYCSKDSLSIGSVVLIPLQDARVPAIIQRKVSKPRFTVKPILRLIAANAVTPPLLRLHSWMLQYYPSPAGVISSLLAPTYLAQKPVRSSDDLNTTRVANSVSLPPLTQMQRDAIATITSSEQMSFLVHGDTASGKTRLYIELAKNALGRGKSTLILTPEIGLTPQLSQRLLESFPGNVVMLHSRQTNAERRSAWLRIASATEPIIVLGPRSALFSPLKKIGYIIIDEAHDGSYKQEQMPYYQSSIVAAARARLEGAKLVLGTATPSIHDYYYFQQKQLPIIRLSGRAKQSTADTALEVINLRDSSSFSRSKIVSDALIGQIAAALQNRQQSLLFLNRRGTARLVICQDCGWQALCPNCNLPLTFHGDKHTLRCHTCGFSQTVPSTCPSCNSTEILFKTIGTKAVVDEVQRLFPNAVTGRFDSDNQTTESIANRFDAVHQGEYDILVGTQMLAKGLDLPKLSVVGLIAADTSLYFPDFSAEERSYQMIRQVIGRVGRGHVSATVVVQTYSPDNIALTAALENDYSLFYSHQIEERKQYHFPPYYFLLKLECSRKTDRGAQKAAKSLYSELQRADDIELIGPTPAFTARAGSIATWQIVVRSRNRRSLLAIIKNLPSGWQYNIDPSNLL